MVRNGGKRKKHIPKHIQSPTTTKRANHTKNPEGYQHQLIAWHFRIMDDSGKWSCDLETVRKILPRLHEYETKRWFEVVKHKRNHPMPVENIEPAAQRRLSKLGFGDTGTLYQLQIAGGGGKQRLWGLRQENVFQIIWWDPNHTIYIPKRYK